MTATVLVLPVSAAPGPEAEPVETSAEQIAMGSVEEPAADGRRRAGHDRAGGRRGPRPRRSSP